jgi:phosphoribosylglycinamide formyltransferase-1
MTINLGILASTRGTDMQAIIDAIERKELDAKIACVVSNKEDCFALERARKHGIEAIFIDPKGKTREEFDREVMRELEKRNVDLVLLIGYMRIVGDEFVEKYRNRMMNIHPSLLPAFGGGMDKEVHKTILDYGVKVSGCTLHFVTEDVDAGPIIAQKAVEIDENETVDSLKEKVQKAEQEIILKAINWFKDGKLKVEGRRVRILE